MGVRILGKCILLLFAYTGVTVQQSPSSSTLLWPKPSQLPFEVTQRNHSNLYLPYSQTFCRCSIFGGQRKTQFTVWLYYNSALIYTTLSKALVSTLHDCTTAYTCIFPFTDDKPHKLSWLPASSTIKHYRRFFSRCTCTSFIFLLGLSVRNQLIPCY